MAGLWLSPAKQRWLRIESVIITVFVLVAGVGMIIDLKDVFVKMVTPPSGLTGIQLLNSSISMWATNVLIFSVVYWRLDRGGNEARAEGAPGTQDWHFPRQDAESGSKWSQWRPTCVDYLFLAFCTATAFSPAHAMPMTSRAKMMLMAESLISLVTVMAIVSRAIGLLGS